MDGSEKSFTVDNHIKQLHICCLISTKRSIGLLPPIRIRRLLRADPCVIYARRFGNASVLEWVRGDSGRVRVKPEIS